ncbi:unnamed protein product [Knipowitschia caucasica]
MKRSRNPSSSDDSDSGRLRPEPSGLRAGNSTCWSQRSSHRRAAGHKPSEVFRTDLITAMKLADSTPLKPHDFYVLGDAWRQEWEKGVQVPVCPEGLPRANVRELCDRSKDVMFVRPKKLIRSSGSEALGYVDICTLSEGTCRYDLDQQDQRWLEATNQELRRMALPAVDEVTMERVLEELERSCHAHMAVAVETQEGLGIEFDEDVVCEVCRSPDGEENNEMVFCDKCNVCVHQACYGIQKVPSGSWLCRTCALGIVPKCQLCPRSGGAMKPTRSGTKWVHVSCALWIPEVSIGNPEKMEPITNVSHIHSSRWTLICCICKEKSGACIQCSAKSCRTAFHVTCCQHAGLEMTTTLTEDEEVKFKAFCPKHSGGEGKTTAPTQTGPQTSSDEHKRVSLRKLKLQEMEDEFYHFVDVQEVATRLKLCAHTVDFLFQYWKLKRKSNHNRALVTPKSEEEEGLARREHEVLRRRLQLFTHLRQDLERVRNLTYMVTRREKMKRSMWRIQEQIFRHKITLLEQQPSSDSPSIDVAWLLSLGSDGHLSSSSSTTRISKHLKKKRKKSTTLPPLATPPHDEMSMDRTMNQTVDETMDRAVEVDRTVNQAVDRTVEMDQSNDGQVFKHKQNFKKHEKRKKPQLNGFQDKQLLVHLVDIRRTDCEAVLLHTGWGANEATKANEANRADKTNHANQANNANQANVKLRCNVSNGLSKKLQANANRTANGNKTANPNRTANRTANPNRTAHANRSANGRSWGKFKIPKRTCEDLKTPLTKEQRLDKDLKLCNGDEATLTRRYDFMRRGVLAS